MYARQFADGPRFRPASLGVALAINAGVIAALLLAGPELIRDDVPPPMTIIDIAPPKPPPPDPKPQPRKPAPEPSATAPAPQPATMIEPIKSTDNTLTGKLGVGDPAGTGNGPTATPTATPIPPLFVAASQDPRYLTDFQPPYPDFERDAGREGVVKLRVRIGVDGRVKQVERMSGRDSFVRVSVAHALAKWRFRPATRGGVPEESWMIITLNFTLTG